MPSPTLPKEEIEAHAILNALSARIAVIDAEGRIVAVNAAWRQFA